MLKLNNFIKYIRFIIPILFVCYNGFCFSQTNEELPIINLEKIKFNAATEIKLDSGWAFYWKELLEPGEFASKKPLNIITLKNWTEFTGPTNEKLPSFGFATYRLQFSIPKDRPNVSLYIPRVLSAYKLWVNGKFILEMGKVGISKSETLHRRFNKIIPLNTEETNFEIVLQVANFYNIKAGLTQPILLGESQAFISKKSVQITADMIFIGSLGFVGCFFLLFYLLYWNKDKAVLYFAILCMALAYHTLNDGYAPFSGIFESISWVLLTKIEYLSLYLAGVAASLFFATVLSEFNHNWYLKIMILSSIVFGVLVIFLPPPYFTKLILPFLTIMLINGVYVFFIIIRAIIAKNKASLLLFVSMVLATVIFTTHIIFFLSENQYALIYVKFGYVAVFLMLSMLLMLRFSKSFKELEQSKELVMQQQNEIVSASEELSKANLKLEENLSILENYNTELKDFNHIVSHDLKTPLISVFSLVSFIEEDLKSTLNEETKHHLKLLKKVVSKMEASIKALLNYSKAARGNKILEYFSVNSLLEKVISTSDYQNNSSINVLDTDVEIYANKVELEHVFQNLISNSIKYNDKEKAIISISLEVKEQEYIFSVQDNGPGIEAKYHTKIFEIFSRLEEDNQDNFESSGIGLAIVKKIISKNYGVITVKSKKGKGLTISFTWKIPNKS